MWPERTRPLSTGCWRCDARRRLRWPVIGVSPGSASCHDELVRAEEINIGPSEALMPVEAAHRGGLHADILTDGLVRVGDPVSAGQTARLP